MPHAPPWPKADAGGWHGEIAHFWTPASEIASGRPWSAELALPHNPAPGNSSDRYGLYSPTVTFDADGLMTTEFQVRLYALPLLS